MLETMPIYIFKFFILLYQLFESYINTQRNSPICWIDHPAGCPTLESRIRSNSSFRIIYLRKLRESQQVLAGYIHPRSLKKQLIKDVRWQAITDLKTLQP